MQKCFTKLKHYKVNLHAKSIDLVYQHSLRKDTFYFWIKPLLSHDENQ